MRTHQNDNLTHNGVKYIVFVILVRTQNVRKAYAKRTQSVRKTYAKRTQSVRKAYARRHTLMNLSVEVPTPSKY